MADSLSTTVSAVVGWDYQSPLDLSTVKDNSSSGFSKTMDSGTGASQADKIWTDTRTLATNANDDLVLSALTKTVFGSTVTCALVKVKGILIVNASLTSGNDLLIGGAASHEWSAALGAAGDKVFCPADSPLLLMNKVAGWAVVAGTTDVLRIHNNSANSITYNVVIWGTSA